MLNSIRSIFQTIPGESDEANWKRFKELLAGTSAELEPINEQLVMLHDNPLLPEQAAQRLHLAFFILSLRCVLANGVSITSLMRQATSGNWKESQTLNALDALLRLDRRCLENQRIRRRVYEALAMNEEIKTTINNALSADSSVMSREKVKRRLALLVLQGFLAMDEFSKSIKPTAAQFGLEIDPTRFRITSPQLRDEFNRCSKSEQDKFDEQVSTDAFSISLWREGEELEARRKSLTRNVERP